MRYIVCREFKFDAAHYLPTYQGNCSQMHGHTWKVQICLSGFSLNSQGMIKDFREIKEIWDLKFKPFLDHHLINDIIPNPTAENIARFLFNSLEEYLGTVLHKIRVYESDETFVEVEN